MEILPLSNDATAEDMATDLRVYIFFVSLFICEYQWRRTLYSRKTSSMIPQTDRATRYVSQTLVNCRNKLYYKSTTNQMEFRGLQLIDDSSTVL